eukprot:m.356057 g.356057  ORF g.356057 m.356057 type:complete len:389 (-) comp55950_c0_seq1:167-1333(-)
MSASCQVGLGALSSLVKLLESSAPYFLSCLLPHEGEDPSVSNVDGAALSIFIQFRRVAGRLTQHLVVLEPQAEPSEQLSNGFPEQPQFPLDRQAQGMIPAFGADPAHSPAGSGEDPRTTAPATEDERQFASSVDLESVPMPTASPVEGSKLLSLSTLESVEALEDELVNLLLSPFFPQGLEGVDVRPLRNFAEWVEECLVQAQKHGELPTIDLDAVTGFELPSSDSAPNQLSVEPVVGAQEELCSPPAQKPELDATPPASISSEETWCSTDFDEDEPAIQEVSAKEAAKGTEPSTTARKNRKPSKKVTAAQSNADFQNLIRTGHQKGWNAEALVMLSIVDLNKYARLHGISSNLVGWIKRHRRRFKGRKYAAKFRLLHSITVAFLNDI